MHFSLVRVLQAHLDDELHLDWLVPYSARRYALTSDIRSVLRAGDYVFY